MKIIIPTLSAILALPALAFAEEPAAGTLIQFNSAEGLLKVGLAFALIEFLRRRQKQSRG
ncbi:MAG: hypothetical protein ACOC4K_03495 [Verrucomicrobiota bacterium]